MLTRFLCLANILIASSVVRRGPYWHLIETCLYTQDYVKHIEIVLEIATQKMGLRHFRDLFEAYATQLAYSIRLSEKDFFRLPPSLLGYENRKECAEATFISFSPTNVLADEQDVYDLSRDTGPFAHHCALIDITVADGLRRCFSNIVAYAVVTWIDEHSNIANEGDWMATINDTSLLNVLHRKFSALGSPQIFQKLLSGNIDAIICSILRMYGDMDPNPDVGGSITDAIKRSKSETIKQTFLAIFQYQSHGTAEIHSPNLPAFGAVIVIRALDWLSGQIQTACSEAATYHVLQRLFADISRSVIVNEQLRLLTSLVLWVALNEGQFNHTTLLRVLMSGATTCLEQVELALFAKGILEWAFIRLREAQGEVQHLVEILLRCATTAAQYSDCSDTIVHDVGAQLKPWLEQQIIFLWRSARLRCHITMSLDAWPNECSEELKALRRKTDTQVLSPIFSQPYSSTHRFKAIRNIPRLFGGPVVIQGFARRDFWKLKECMPSTGLSTEEIDAFADLLVANSGHVQSRGFESRVGRTIGSRHLEYSTDQCIYAAKKSIVHSLLDRMLDQQAGVVDVSYRTLRLLAGTEPLGSPSFGSWPSEVRGDVGFLDFCQNTELVQASVQITDILDPRYLQISSNFDVWVCTSTALLCGAFAAVDHFFAQITEVVRSSAEFSEQVLPVLVHCLLLQGRKSSKDEIGSSLSQYFTDIIAYPDLDVRCHRTVVDLIIHLRHFGIPNTKDPLGYNRWLDINFALLSNSAIACGAYTTALLFLELAAEYAQLNRTEASAMEQTLFEIYSHIDEPDGFYGIKSSDLQNNLLRRFRHEHQWDKAFQFHGAQFEVEGHQHTASIGIVESLHSFGFNKLAMSTLQSFWDHQSPGSSDLAYKLGWRTGAWDLPDVKLHGSPNASLYAALRAVHRDLHEQSMMSVVSNSMESEMHRLRNLGNENLFEIRQVTQNLMCLAQIRRWLVGSISSNISADSIANGKSEARKFFTMQGDFE